MDFLLMMLFGVYAEGDALSGGLFGVITEGANTAVAIIKWAALLYVLVRIAMLGFKIATNSKSSSDAMKLVKEEGLALVIGLFIVMAAFLIHSTLESTIETVGGNGDQNETITVGDSDF